MPAEQVGGDVVVRLKELRRKRATLRAKFTTFSTIVLSNRKFKDNIPVRQLDHMKKRLDDCISAWDEFDEVQSEIESLADDVEVELGERAVTETTYFEMTSEAELMMQASTATASTSPPDSTGLIAASAEPSSTYHGVKLPIIELPKFGGQFECWLEFRDTFKALIHENPSISDMQRFHYLRATLKDSAAEVISGIELSEANYIHAWEAVCDRYNNSPKLVFNHVRQLFELPAIKGTSSMQMRNLLSGINRHLTALKQLGQETERWDLLLIYMVINKLDTPSKEAWEERRGSQALPTLQELKEFLSKRVDVLEVLEGDIAWQRTHAKAASNVNQNVKPKYVKSFPVSNKTCTFCNGSHCVTSCDILLGFTTQLRIEKIRECKLCANCLKVGHYARDCRHPGRCNTCRGRHHTMLHLNKQTRSAESNEEPSVKAASEGLAVTTTSCTVAKPTILLPTALVLVTGAEGRTKLGRVLLDTGSQANFVTREFIQDLGVNVTQVKATVSGISQDAMELTSGCTIQIQSRVNKFCITAKCLVTNEICGQLGQGFKLRNDVVFPRHLKLADPSCLNISKIDILLGSEHFWSLMSIGQLPLAGHDAMLQKTRFGWIVGGMVNSYSHQPYSKCNLTAFSELHDHVEKFWQLEECNVKAAELNETQCAHEQHFCSTHSRDETGRFIVKIPFNKAPSTLGNSYDHALKRLTSLETKLKRNHDLRIKYNEFMQEYLAMGHMTLSHPGMQDGYFIPHHCVINECSATTKLRVVFDASARASCGNSLNELQSVGPVIQPDLFQILIGFRVHKIIVVADIAKMYRQVLVEPSQRKYQQILWRNAPTERIRSYMLNTVTYGTASASYLAIRCLEQLAREVETTYPKVGKTIRSCFYVDDLIAGFNNEEEAVEVCNDLNTVLQSGCFPLRKWASNAQGVTERLKTKFVTDEEGHVFSDARQSKTLGLQWKHTSDTLSFIANTQPLERITKRTILSEVAGIFDPLGLIAPCVVTAKILLQKLWQEKVTWDESISLVLATEWKGIKGALQDMSRLSIPRFALAKGNANIQMHGFCDASQVAYGAAIYLVSNGASNLLCAKTRVAPLKQLSIPRLELLAAVLLSRLISIVKDTMPFEVNQVSLWSDSMVVLGWIRSSKLDTTPIFVRNRIREIRSNTVVAEWRHVPTHNNPADLLSRGATPKGLGELWWNGPSWLTLGEDEWPRERTCMSAELVEESAACAVVCDLRRIEEEVFPICRFSSLRTLIRVTAYAMRFMNNTRRRSTPRSRSLTVDEIDEALIMLVRHEQRRFYVEAISCLSRNKRVPGGLVAMTPFLDDQGTIRVGGRLRNAAVPYQQRHPALLPAKSQLTRLIIEHEHVQAMHAGPQGTLNAVRMKFWLVSGGHEVRRVLHQCVKCRRCKPVACQPIMGNLPKVRVTASYPFANCGVDFAGPYLLKTVAGRGSRTYKAYVALFVCMTTRAVHLELVTSLETAAFLACLRRFAARRGCPSNLYSDNATNFRGTSNELQRFMTTYAASIEGSAAEQNIKWHFIPAQSPNFGGLWEAGVKSAKYHLTRVIGERRLTYEQMITLLYQIESILNSRPIAPLSTSPNDDPPLTPAHFLIGRTMRSPPDEVGLDELPDGKLSTYQRIQSLVQGFWKRWSREYLNQLRQRSKWSRTSGCTPSVGTLVMLSDQNSSPLRWKWGIVSDIHPGSDGVVRVVSVRTNTGTVRRAVSKVCPLLSDEEFTAYTAPGSRSASPQ